MAKEMMIIFVYDTECCKDEVDDPVNAVLYFHPSWVSNVQKVSLCGQLMGTTHFLRGSFGKPKIISLQTGKFSVKDFGRFILVVGTDRNLSNSILEHRSELLSSLVKFFHQDIKSMHERFSNSGQYKNFSEKLYHLFETYLPILHYSGNIFQNMPISRLPKSASNIFLDAMHTLESCQQIKGVLGGSIFYNNKVIATQLPSGITKKFIITDHHQIKSTSESVSVNFHVPIGVQLIIVFIPIKDYRKLTNDADRAKTVMNQNVPINSIIPFQLKKKLKRDKSLIFTNIPEEGFPDEEEFGQFKSLSTIKTVAARPNHLPLRCKNNTTKDLTESGFSSITFDESDSFPQFIGRTSVCSTPITENKILHGMVLPICVNHNNEPFQQATNQFDSRKPIEDTNLSNYVINPFKEEIHRNSLTDLHESIKNFSRRLVMRTFSLNSMKINFNYNNSDADEIEIVDFENKTYRTITDPTYPVFNCKGAPISKCLFQEYLDSYISSLNTIDSNNDNDKAINSTFDQFDSEINLSPVQHQQPVEPIEIDSKAILQVGQRNALSLPLKPLTLDQEGSSLRSAKQNIIGLPSRKKSNGMQLTPLMTKLSILAMHEEGSSGCASWDTTPGIEFATPIDGAAKFIRRKSSVKFDELIGGTDTEEMQKCELFICSQQSITMILLMEENSCEKQELIQAMFETCVSRLSRIETNLNQSLNVNVDGDKRDIGYSFLLTDPHWDTLQRGGLWSNIEMVSLEYMGHSLKTGMGLSDLIIRTEDSVLYGYQYGQSTIFYKQGAQIQNGLPPPTDVMGTASIIAQRTLERDHSIILL